ncbi:MAG: hypothetical protein ACLUPL_05265 [Butyricimonas virosa]
MEEFSTAVHAGHPTMMLIDDRGIIRGRWDAWSPGTVANAALAVWVLKIVPQQGVTLDLDLARQYMKEKIICGCFISLKDCLKRMRRG